MDAEILAAVAAEAPAMTELLTELVAAPTLLGEEAPGQEVMRRAFDALGLEPFDVPLDAAALERHPAGAPFGWDVAEKANVLADWQPAGAADGRSLILNGHIDVVSPEPGALWSGDAVRAAIDGEWMYGRGAGDMKAGLGGDRRRVARPAAARPRPARAGAAPVGGRGGVHRQRRARLRAGRATRADAAILPEPTSRRSGHAQVGVLWFQVRVLGAPAHAGVAGATAPTRSRPSYAVIAGVARRSRRSRTARHRRCSPTTPTRSTSTSVMIRGGDWPSTMAGECVAHCRLALYPGDTSRI